MIELTDLLVKEGLDPRRVLVMRHRPTEKQLRDVLPWLAEEKPEIYNSFQSEHGERTEGALSRATHLASFIGHEARKGLFVGVYNVAGFKRVTVDQFWRMPHNEFLRTLGTRGPASGRTPYWFDLQPSEDFEGMKGRLVVEWPGIERSWWRWADRNTFAVHAIHDESLLVPKLEDWSTLVLSWQKLQALPKSWRQALSHWRGVYFIFDQAAGMGYVGSAYGEENLLGRWLNYAASGHGGNRLLKSRDPSVCVQHS